MTYAFVSYSRGDRDLAGRLIRKLVESGIQVWVDHANIPPGAAWDAAIQSALDGAVATIVVLSPEAVRSPNVLDEISFSLDHRKLVIPVLLRPCEKPLRLSRIQHVDGTGDMDRAIDQLKVLLQGALKQPPADEPRAEPRPAAQTPDVPKKGASMPVPALTLTALAALAIIAALWSWFGVRTPTPTPVKAPLPVADAPRQAAQPVKIDPCALPFDQRPVSCLTTR